MPVCFVSIAAYDLGGVVTNHRRDGDGGDKGARACQLKETHWCSAPVLFTLSDLLCICQPFDRLHIRRHIIGGMVMVVIKGGELFSLFHWRSTTSLTTLPTLPDARSHLLPLI